MNQYSSSRPGSDRGRSNRAARPSQYRSSSEGRGRAAHPSERGGQGGGSRYAGRPGNSYGGRRSGRNNKNKQKEQMIKLAIGGVLLIVAIVCIVLAVRGIAGGKGKDETQEGVSANIPANTSLSRDVSVDGKVIKAGTAFDEVEKAVAKQYEWGMKVTYQGEERELTNPIKDRVKALVEEIYQDAGEPEASSSSESESGAATVKEYALDVSGLEDAFKEDVEAMAAQWDKPAKNGRIDRFDKENNKFIYAGEEKGMVIDQQKLLSDIQAALEEKDLKATIAASGNQVDPEITEAKAKEMYKVVGQFGTTTTKNADRNTNVRLATEAIDGMIIQPGEEFSFNKTTGNRTTEKGYRPAGAYVNGVLVEEPGGGVCQVSSTLYNAVVFSGLEVLERHPHSYEPSYVTPGEDAMVSYDGHTGPDMRFRNNSPSAVAIRGSFADRKLTMSIVAIPILEEGTTITMSSKKTSESEPPATPTYEENPTLQPDQEVQVKAPTKGSVWETKVIKKTPTGEEVIKTYTSRYRGKGATIQRNTSGTVVTVPESTPVETSPVETTPVETTVAQPTNPDGTPLVGPGVSQPGTTAPSTTAPAAPGGDGSSGGPGAGGGGGGEPSSSTDSFIAPSPLTDGTQGGGPG